MTRALDGRWLLLSLLAALMLFAACGGGDDDDDDAGIEATATGPHGVVAGSGASGQAPGRA